MIGVPEVETSEYDKEQMLTESAFSAMVTTAICAGILPEAANRPFDDFPDEQVAQQFKEACKAVIEKLKAVETPAQQGEN